MKTSKTFRFVLVGITAGLIVACGGGGSVGTHFPLVSSVRLVGVNNDVDNIHFVMDGEAYDPSNRVTPGVPVERNGTATYTWDNDQEVEIITVRAGRNGADIQTKTVGMAGQSRMDGKKVHATWDGTDLTLSIGN